MNTRGRGRVGSIFSFHGNITIRAIPYYIPTCMFLSWYFFNRILIRIAHLYEFFSVPLNPLIRPNSSICASMAKGANFFYWKNKGKVSSKPFRSAVITEYGSKIRDWNFPFKTTISAFYFYHQNHLSKLTFVPSLSTALAFPFTGFFFGFSSSFTQPLGNIV